MQLDAVWRDPFLSVNAIKEPDAGNRYKHPRLLPALYRAGSRRVKTFYFI
jgi:hypothetical protein